MTVELRDGRRLGAFRLGQRIGAGGLGEVWSALHIASGRDAAIKVITAHHASGEAFRRGFRREVEATARLDHIGIVRLYDHGLLPDIVEDGLVPGSPYLVMEKLGPTIVDRRVRPHNRDAVVDLLLSILDALSHAHARGVIHRDLKPANILLRVDGDRAEPTIIDFGIASLTEEADRAWATAGTPAFMAPEQIREDWARDQGPATDLYALGCVAHVLAAGRPPFLGASVEETCRMHLETDPKLGPWTLPLPGAFRVWLERLLAKHPDDRFSTAADAAFALARIRREADQGKAALDTADIADDLLGAPTGATAAPWDVGGTRPAETAISRVALSPTWTTLGSVLDAADVSPLPRTASVDDPPPPFPERWEREDDDLIRPLSGAGLGLFAHRIPRMADREVERGRLWTALRKLTAEGGRRAVILRGPAGVGKSRLAYWLCERAAELGVARPVRTEHSDRDDRGAGLARLVRRLTGCDGLTADEAHARMGRLLRRRGIMDAYLPRAATALMFPSEQPDIFAGTQQQFAAVELLLRHLTGDRPVVLWLDDVAHAGMTLGLTRFLLEGAHRLPRAVLIVMTARDESLDAQPEQRAILDKMTEREDVDQLEVGPLAESDQRSLVEHLLPVAGTIADQLCDRTAGNPMFAVQILGDWAERGVFASTEDGFALRDGADARLPDSIGEVWGSRLESALASAPNRHDALTLLRLAAMLGNRVLSEEIEAVAERTGIKDVADAFESAIRANLLTPDGDSLVFAHGLLAEFLVASTPKTSRTELHEQCALALESIAPADGPSPSSERRAQHWTLAGDPDRAARAYRDAVQYRFDRGDVDTILELIDAMEASVRANDRGEDRLAVETLCLRARANSSHGNATEARRHGERALEIAEAHGWRDLAAQARMRLAGVDEGERSLPEARARYKTIIDDARALGDDALALEAGVRLTFVTRLLGDSEAALALSDTCLAEARKSSKPDVICRVLATRGGVLSALGRDDDEADVIEELRTLAEANDLLYAQGRAWNRLGELRRARGELGGAEVAYERSATIMATTGYWIEVPVPQLNLALVRILRNDFAGAAPVIDDVIAAWRRQGRDLYLAFAFAGQLACLAHARRWDAFDACLEALRENQGASGIHDRDIAKYVEHAAELAARAGAAERARAAGQFAASQWRALDDVEAAERAERIGS